MASYCNAIPTLPLANGPLPCYWPPPRELQTRPTKHARVIRLGRYYRTSDKGHNCVYVIAAFFLWINTSLLYFYYKICQAPTVMVTYNQR